MLSNDNKKLSKGSKILFSGGGTLGSITPLLAVMNYIKKNYPQDELIWVTTKTGLEKEFLNNYNFQKYAISSAKLRRYFSVQNFIDIFRFIKSFFEAYQIIKNTNPDVIVSAGSYLSVPLAIIGRLMSKKVLIHQQDIKVGLANRIMSGFAHRITLSFWESAIKFNKHKVYLTGNPSRFTRQEIDALDRDSLLKKYNFKADKKILLVLGGSSGSAEINNVIYKSLTRLLNKYQLIHITGLNKDKKITKDDYYQYDFIDKEMLDFMFLADLVVSRAGFATLTELSCLAKCAIIVPLKGHQEINAGYFYKEKAIELCNSEHLISTIFDLSKNKSKKESLIEHISRIMPRNATQKIVDQIYKLIQKQ